MEYIPYGRQSISREDVDRVVEVLNSDFLTQGPVVEKFERSLAAYVSAEFGVAVNSATSALHLACRALGVQSGDVVWTTPNTFVATANAAMMCGANVDFVDIDPDTWNMSVGALEQKLEHSRTLGTLPKVVIPVHFGGLSCDMKKIHELSQAYGFRVVEDASHAIGGDYEGQKVGCCKYSDITVFSFHPVKIITSGEGGFATTNSQQLFERLTLLRSHGVTRDKGKMKGPSHGDWYYQQIDLGYNYRITDIQCALGLSQLQRVDGFVEKRNHIASKYQQKLCDLQVKSQGKDSVALSAYHLFVITMPAGQRKRVFDHMRSKGVGVNVHYISVHLQPYYLAQGFKEGDYPNSESYYQSCISLPLFPDLTEEQQDYVVESLKEALL